MSFYPLLGSMFTKAKPQHSWFAVTRLGLMRVIFMPFYYKWSECIVAFIFSSWLRPLQVAAINVSLDHVPLACALRLPVCDNDCLFHRLLKSTQCRGGLCFVITIDWSHNWCLTGFVSGAFTQSIGHDGHHWVNSRTHCGHSAHWAQSAMCWHGKGSLGVSRLKHVSSTEVALLIIQAT